MKHLPGFLEKADELKSKGVDTIACVAVNDAFVMDAWSKSVGTDDKIMMLADGSADFTKVITLPELISKQLGVLLLTHTIGQSVSGYAICALNAYIFSNAFSLYSNRPITLSGSLNRYVQGKSCLKLTCLPMRHA